MILTPVGCPGCPVTGGSVLSPENQVSSYQCVIKTIIVIIFCIVRIFTEDSSSSLELEKLPHDNTI